MTDTTPQPPRWQWRCERRADTPADPHTGPADLDELAAPPVPTDGEIPVGEFTEREWAIFRQGQRWGWESRQVEVTTLTNAYIRADDDANLYYRAAFDHDYHDCAIHQNKGQYQGSRTRLLHWASWDDEDEQYPPDPELQA